LASAEDRPLLLAHRGDHRRAPENTVAALAAALAIPGCDGVELDVRASADGEAVLGHDATLARVFGRSERVRDLSTSALRAVGIPTLLEALVALPARTFVDVELKEDVVPTALSAVAAARGDPPAGIVLSSFDGGLLARVGAEASSWPRWLNARVLDHDTVARARRLGCAGVSVDWRALDAGSVARARAAGLSVAAWTVRRRASVTRLAAFGVQAICVEGEALQPGA